MNVDSPPPLSMFSSRPAHKDLQRLVSPNDDVSRYVLSRSRSSALSKQDLEAVGGNSSLVSRDQVQSMLFSKLPFDVRYLIYKELLLAGWILTVSGLGSTLRMPRFIVKSKVVTRYQHGRDIVRHVATEVFSGLYHLLPLLKTCRRVYASCPPSPFLTLKREQERGGC